MVDRTSGLQYQTGQGYSALDAQAARDRLDGFSVVSGCGVSPGGSLSVDVAAGEALVGGTTVSPGSVQNVSLTAADSTNPRKDTIYIDDTGTAQVETGAAESALPEGNARFNTFQPEPPRPATDGTILAEVWVAAGASSLSSADVRDRRQPADVVGGTGVFDSVSTDTMTINQIYNTPKKTKTISSGEVSVSDASYVELVPESGTSDDLADILDATDGQIVVLQVNSGSNKITVKDATGNIFLDGRGDKTLTTPQDKLELIYHGDFNTWNQIGFSSR